MNEGKTHGHNALRISQLFAKVCSILRFVPIQSYRKNLVPSLKEYANTSTMCFGSPQESSGGDISIGAKDTRKVSCQHLVFLWGFSCRMTAGTLKRLLQGSHTVFSEEFDVRLVDKSCAIVVFWKPGLSDTFLEVINSQEISGSLRELVSEGLRAACYETYKNICRLGIWEVDLAQSLEKALEEPDCLEKSDSESNPLEVCWFSDSIINLDDL